MDFSYIHTYIHTVRLECIWVSAFNRYRGIGHTQLCAEVLFPIMYVCMYICMYVSFRMKICTVYMSSMHGCASATLADILANSGRTTFSPTTAPYEMMHPLGTTAPLLMTAPSQMMDWVTLALSSMTAPVAMRCDAMQWRFR